MLLAQWMLRPIHVIQSSLSRLGRGELDVRLDLPEQEFKDLGSSFEAVSAQLAAVGSGGDGEGTLAAGGGADYESVMENLEDAVALFSPEGRGDLQQRRDARAASRICRSRIRRASWSRGRCATRVIRPVAVERRCARRDAGDGAPDRPLGGGREPPTSPRRTPSGCWCATRSRTRAGGSSAPCSWRGTSAT